MTEESYIFVGDILGFGNITRNLSPEELDARVDEWTQLVEASASKHNIQRFQLISDTVFAGTPSSDEGFSALSSFARDLLTVGIKQSIPIRGAITHGRYSWGKLTYGPPVVAAHELERSQNWIGVVYDNGLPHLRDSMLAVDRIVCYLPPTRSNLMRLHPALAWDIPDTKTLTGLMCKKGLTKAGDLIPWAVMEKASNTVLFRLYTDFLKASRLPPSQFYGVLPIQAIEAQFDLLQKAYPTKTS